MTTDELATCPLYDRIGAVSTLPKPTQAPASKETFESDQDVRWCPGCGDYSILAQLQRVLPTLGIPRENFAFISGIGCSSRFPYYMNTYGFHTIHGRAPTIATGIKVAHPELSVWVITGDGDALSIGGNHFVHLMRRNIDINVVLFNNRIYGLTKGQYSPTSEQGKITKSSPMGTVDKPFNPARVALAAGATFVARSIDRDAQHLRTILKAAYEHRGTSFVEVYQNCVIFNNGAFASQTERAAKPENTLYLEHGKPLVFGSKGDKGIRLNGLRPEIIQLNNGKYTLDDVMVHDQHSHDPLLADFPSVLAEIPGFPHPMGIFRSIEEPCYEALIDEQVNQAKERLGKPTLDSILDSGDSWIVPATT